MNKFLPDDFSWLYAVILSFWGCIVQYATRVKNGEPAAWRPFILDLVICSFAGVISFFACQELGLSGWKMAIVVSLSAHEGTRAIGLWTQFRDNIVTRGVK